MYTHSGQNRPDDFENILDKKAFFMRTFEEEMLIRSHTTTLIQIFCELLLNYQVIFKGVRVADDTFFRNSECE